MLLFLSALAADDTIRHWHKGKLPKYQLGPPSLMLSEGDEEQLAQGRAIMQVIVAAVTAKGEERRLIMVRDVETPAWVVMDRLLDFDAYPRMIKGCESLEPYADAQQDGVRVFKATYEIRAVHMKLKYYMLHRIDTAQRCMTFHLDYARRSDLDDSVGYWYVLPKGPTSCRVFYSCDTKLRGWYPAPVYQILGKTALKQATSWVHEEAVKEYRKIARLHGADRLMTSLRSRVPRLQTPALPKMPKPLLKPASWTRARWPVGRRTVRPSPVASNFA